MNYNVSSSYLRFEQRSDSLPVTWKYSGEDQSSNHWNEKLCTFSSSGDTLYFTIDNNTGETWASGAYAVPNEITYCLCRCNLKKYKKLLMR